MNNKKEMIFGMISKISGGDGGADVSGVTATAGDVDEGKVFVDSTGTEVTGISTYKADYTALNALVLGTTATQADVDSGKLFVQSDGTQGTGSSTYKADYTALNTLVGQTTATDSDVASGKLYVKADGTQGTGTASGGGGGNEEYIKYLNRPVGSTINIPEGATKIPDYAFSDAGSVSVVLSDTITQIGKYAFRNINQPVESLPSGIWSIDDYAFYQSGRTFSSLPASLQYIGQYAFYKTTKMRSNLTLPSNLSTISSYAFGQIEGEKLKSITFKNKPSTIASTAFSYNNYLTTIRVPWASGEVSGAPWGATNASITYNYTP